MMEFTVHDIILIATIILSGISQYYSLKIRMTEIQGKIDVVNQRIKNLESRNTRIDRENKSND
jgi:cell division protein FtsL